MFVALSIFEVSILASAKSESCKRTLISRQELKCRLSMELAMGVPTTFGMRNVRG
jgi:hypothetical protein